MTDVNERSWTPEIRIESFCNNRYDGFKYMVVVDFDRICCGWDEIKTRCETLDEAIQRLKDEQWFAKEVEQMWFCGTHREYNEVMELRYEWGMDKRPD